jgi:hypothetical protein
MYKSIVISLLANPDVKTLEVDPNDVLSSDSIVLLTVQLVHWSVSDTLLTSTPGLERYVEVAMV